MVHEQEVQGRIDYFEKELESRGKALQDSLEGITYVTHRVETVQSAERGPEVHIMIQCGKLQVGQILSMMEISQYAAPEPILGSIGRDLFRKLEVALMKEGAKVVAQ
jgi:hypothetical protein